ncbi:DUF6461 domain-containing protein [Streptosporangium amethystogenes subsp. fukuiense]|uniref:DUF6461 domain-containing protein n=1 Tax=Streptosporangium amethystogenes subsp. fukuiense TaxID=698418 RepID=A0ABW2TEN2_9ACTN
MTDDLNLYDLLDEYDLDNEDFGFRAAWCEGLTGEEAARRLRADLDSAYTSTIDELMHEEGDSDFDEGAVLIGPAGTWTMILQLNGLDCTRYSALEALSAGAGRAVGIGWSVNGDERLIYAEDGRVLVSMDFMFPEDRSGPDRQALDPYMEGLVLAYEEGADVEESIDAALTLIGRITGHPIDRDWVEARHTFYVIPRDAWAFQS